VDEEPPQNKSGSHADVLRRNDSVCASFQTLPTRPHSYRSGVRRALSTLSANDVMGSSLANSIFMGVLSRPHDCELGSAPRSSSTSTVLQWPLRMAR